MAKGWNKTFSAAEVTGATKDAADPASKRGKATTRLGHGLPRIAPAVREDFRRKSAAKKQARAASESSPWARLLDATESSPDDPPPLADVRFTLPTPAEVIKPTEVVLPTDVKRPHDVSSPPEASESSVTSDPGAPDRDASETGTAPRSPASGSASSLSASSSSSSRSQTAYSIEFTDDGDEKPDRARNTTRASWIEAALRGEHKRPVGVALVPGQLIPGTRYRILRWLGDGGMGVVYEAQHVDIERRVALKVLRHEVCEDPQAIKAFRDEARTVGRIGAEQIVDIFDFGELPDGRLMFAMELIEGEPLFKLYERGPLAPARVIGILRQICKGLSAAHDAGVIHRDIKPDNILIGVRRGRGDAVKILDFGIATILAEHKGESVGIAGTPYYLAPEIVSGLTFDGRADLYALGCTAYEMLVGQPPFFHEEMDEALRAHVVEEPKRPSRTEAGKDIPPALEAVVLRCLAKLPDERYADMNALEAALCRAQIEAGLISEWDDLPLPEIEPEERAALLAAYAELGVDRVPRRRTRTRWWFAAVVGVLLSAVLLFFLRPGLDEGQLGQLDLLSEQAEAAASRALYVYPPLDEPGMPTAYSSLQEIDALRGRLGRRAAKRASELRGEFADTLVRLGDEYWERPGGKGFAVDYYAQALLFEPDNPSANARVTFTPGQLSVLRDKVERRDFTERDLFIAQTLHALAEQDPEARARKIAALQQDDTRAVSTKETLAEIMRDDEATAAARPRAKAKRRTSKPSATVKPAAADTADGASSDEEERASAAPKTAKELVTAARREVNAGRDKAARRLFEKALANDSKNAAALIGLSDVSFNRGDYDEAVNYARRAVKLKPRRAGYRILLGDAYYKVFRYKEAREQYVKAESLGHRDAARRVAKVDAKL